MPSNFTENFNLSQWEPGDKVQRTDFNADNAKIDAALMTKVSIVTGTYKGDNAESRFIDLGFTPQAVLLFMKNGATYDNSSHYGGLALPGHPVQHSSHPILSITEGGFIVYCKFASNDKFLTNHSTYSYAYIAFR